MASSRDGVRWLCFHSRLVSDTLFTTSCMQKMTRSISAPSVCLTDPAQSLGRAIHEDARKEATQRQTESAHFAPWNASNTYSATMESNAHGRAYHAMHKNCSVNRLENHDFGIVRKNNHYSSNDK